MPFKSNTYAAVRRFADEANTILLDAGSVICDVTDGEPCQVQSSGSTTSSESGLFRVDVTAYDGVEYAQTEVFEGEATVTIPETGESVTLKAGEAATTAKPEGKSAYFVQAEAAQAEENTDAEAAAQNIHPINYQSLPEAILEKLQAIHAMLEACGWIQTGPRRFSQYGPQRAYVKVVSE